MTATLPDEVQEVFERFITCEYTTVAGDQPIVWPVTPYYKAGAPTIDVSTGVGYPKKADDAAAHPSVSLLFSDPTGSGIESPISVLIQGTAEIDDDFDANEARYWREVGEKLPATKDMNPPKPLRRLFRWYYARIYIKVRPERVYVWPDGDTGKPPDLHDAHIEEVRSGHSEEPAKPHRLPDAGPTDWDDRIEELGRRYETAVLSWLAPDGFPLAARLPVNPDRDAGRIRILSVPAGLPMPHGRACLVAHSHGPRFEWQENFQVRGELLQDGSGWALVPTKLVGGFELPDESMAARYRRNLGKSIRFYRTARKRLKQR